MPWSSEVSILFRFLAFHSFTHISSTGIQVKKFRNQKKSWIKKKKKKRPDFRNLDPAMKGNTTIFYFRPNVHLLFHSMGNGCIQHVWFAQNSPLIIVRLAPQTCHHRADHLWAWKDYLRIEKDYLRLGKTIYGSKKTIYGLRLFLQNS